MLCSVCKKNEGVYAVAGEDGEEMLLCGDCYARLGAAAEYAALSGAEEGGRCPVCGRTFADYKRTGLVGCAQCYTAFREELLPVIRRMHGKTVHMGGHPLGNGRLYELLDERNRLRAELESAVKRKDMAEAERLNRDIREISRVIYRGGTEDGDDQ